jgi:hypothetical protein
VFTVLMIVLHRMFPCSAIPLYTQKDKLLRKFRLSVLHVNRLQTSYPSIHLSFMLKREENFLQVQSHLLINKSVATGLGDSRKFKLKCHRDIKEKLSNRSRKQ